jgi:hypothetical protein
MLHKSNHAKFVDKFKLEILDIIVIMDDLLNVWYQIYLSKNNRKQEFYCAYFMFIYIYISIFGIKLFPRFYLESSLLNFNVLIYFRIGGTLHSLVRSQVGIHSPVVRTESTDHKIALMFIHTWTLFFWISGWPIDWRTNCWYVLYNWNWKL